MAPTQLAAVKVRSMSRCEAIVIGVLVDVSAVGYRIASHHVVSQRKKKQNKNGQKDEKMQSIMARTERLTYPSYLDKSGR